MSIAIVQAGPWKGRPIRKARVAGQCDYWRGTEGRCPNPIDKHSYYVAGDPNDRAGGYGRDRYCMACAGQEARDALAAVFAEAA